MSQFSSDTTVFMIESLSMQSTKLVVLTFCHQQNNYHACCMNDLIHQNNLILMFSSCAVNFFTVVNFFTAGICFVLPDVIHQILLRHIFNAYRSRLICFNQYPMSNVSLCFILIEAIKIHTICHHFPVTLIFP